MGLYLTDEADLKSVANAIRSKGSTITALSFPTGFVSAINNLSSGSSAPDAYIVESHDDSYRLTSVEFVGDVAILPAAYYNKDDSEFTSISFTTNDGGQTCTYIGRQAFQGCSQLAITTLPNSIEYIGENAFRECKSFNLSSLPTSLKELGDNAFYGGMLLGLGLSGLPSGIQKLGDNCLANPGKMSVLASSLTIPDTVTTIGAGVFGNSPITTITFKGMPQTISDTAFTGLGNLTTINVPWAEGVVTNAPWGATNATINYNQK